MQYFRFLPDPAKLRKEARWSGVSSVPGIGGRPSVLAGGRFPSVRNTAFARAQLLAELENFDKWPNPDVIGKWSLQAEFVKRGGLDSDPAGVEGAVIDHQ